MNERVIIALAYLLSEAVAAGLKISDILSQVDSVGALPPEEIEKIKLGLRQDFDEARAFWGVEPKS